MSVNNHLPVQEQENFLVRLDKAFDYCPLISTITNLGVLILLKPVLLFTRGDGLRTGFLRHIETKELSRCFIGLIPFIGNLILFHRYPEQPQIREVAQLPEQPQNEEAAQQEQPQIDEVAQLPELPRDEEALPIQPPPSPQTEGEILEQLANDPSGYTQINWETIPDAIVFNRRAIARNPAVLEYLPCGRQNYPLIMDSLNVDGTAIRFLDEGKQSVLFALAIQLDSINDVKILLQLSNSSALLRTVHLFQRETSGIEFEGTLLEYAIALGRVNHVKALVDQRMDLLRHRIRDQRLPIHTAARYGQLEIVRYFIEQDPELLTIRVSSTNSRDRLLPSSLAWANGQQPVFDFLVRSEIENAETFHAFQLTMRQTPSRVRRDEIIMEILSGLDSTRFETIRNSILAVTYLTHIIPPERASNLVVNPQTQLLLLFLAINEYLDGTEIGEEKMANMVFLFRHIETLRQFLNYDQQRYPLSRQNVERALNNLEQDLTDKTLSHPILSFFEELQWEDESMREHLIEMGLVTHRDLLPLGLLSPNHPANEDLFRACTAFVEKQREIGILSLDHLTELSEQVRNQNSEASRVMYRDLRTQVLVAFHNNYETIKTFMNSYEQNSLWALCASDSAITSQIVFGL